MVKRSVMYIGLILIFIMPITKTLAGVSSASTSNHAKASTEQKPVIAKKLDAKKKLDSNPLGIALFRPTYVLPFYYTASPYQAVYAGNTPWNQPIDNAEFKAQISFQVPVIQNLFSRSDLSLNAGYTQLSYWQFYAKSQYFRETDYEPELFVSKKLKDNQILSVGLTHQSNGRGGDLERSWNRAYLDYAYSGVNWMVEVKPWVLIFPSESINLHNSNIAHYLGYGWVVGAYKFHNQTIALKLRNEVESGFSRGAEELDWSFPIHGRFNLFVQVFSGYGQSLIEYDHYTNAIGIGLALNNWM